MSYTPDFKVEGVFYEIKGRWRDIDRLKIELFRQKFPDHRLEVIGPREYEQLRQQYKPLLREAWEGR